MCRVPVPSDAPCCSGHSFFGARNMKIGSLFSKSVFVDSLRKKRAGQSMCFSFVVVSQESLAQAGFVQGKRLILTVEP